MNDDHLSPEPLSSYEEYQGNEKTTEQEESQAKDVDLRTQYLDVAGPFTKIELEKQKRDLDNPEMKLNLTPHGAEYLEIRGEDYNFQTRQIQFREQTLEGLNNRARDDFNIYGENRNAGLER